MTKFSKILKSYLCQTLQLRLVQKRVYGSLYSRMSERIKTYIVIVEPGGVAYIRYDTGYLYEVGQKS